jgi:hypothetical protein
MSIKKDKLIRKVVKQSVNDQSKQYLLAMLDNPLLTRLRWCIIILFKLGYKDLITGGISETGRKIKG